ncbi:MAG: membrane protein insertase YidC [Clostridia bacterium]|nr:membrane protein insertase YidC [Clostridia bacterium]
MFNLLAESGTLGYGIKAISDVGLNWIGQLIRILIEGIGIVGVGIIVFTLILKTIVLPLDIYSRINGKKQALIMERMRPQMEKLQKQYANDKNMYQQKVMELQKKNGYSMFGACLPMIVSLVIFIVVFNAFSTYSQYANLKNYNDMVHVYNGVVTSYVIDDDNPYTATPDKEGEKVRFLIPVYEGEGEKRVIADYKVNYAYFTVSYNWNKTHDEKNNVIEGNDWTELDEEGVFDKLVEEYKQTHKSYDGSFYGDMVNYKVDGELSETAVAIRNTLVSYYLETPAAQAVKDYYVDGHNNSFLWVHNLWYPDSTLNKEIPSFSKFQSTVTKASIGDDYAESYNKVTAALGTQKGRYNGYFILIILSIGLMLLQQWISMRSNKSVNELSTVDGSGAKTNKYMMIMMPIIYGMFSFFYSASFSLYMITNTVYGLVTTLIINKCVDVWFKKKEEKGELDEYLAKKQRKGKSVNSGLKSRSVKKVK